MPSALEISLIFLAIYIALALYPGLIGQIRQLIGGLSYFFFSIFFLVYIYQTYRSTLYTVLTFFGLFIFMYIFQIILGVIKRIYNKPEI